MKVDNSIKTNHGDITLPAFMPDATYGAIKSISFNDVKETGTKEIVTTTLHIEQHLGSNFVEEFGGLHKFFGWDRPILTDSGGFQVFSLIHASDIKENKITEKGAYFKNPINGSIFELSPETSQQIQHKLGSDIRIVLDEPVFGNQTREALEENVRRTTAWAKRSKDEFLRIYGLTQAEFNNPEKYPRPLLFAVIQGGNDLELRKRSFDQLHEIGFDGYNWGGWPTDEGGQLNTEVGQTMINLIPKDKVAYAMGVGTPDNIVDSFKMGWELFDCVLPSRNARHGYFYVAKGQGDQDFENYSVIHIKREQYKKDERPIDETCNCECCRSVSRAYLKHLIKIKESSGMRLATIHNLTFYANLLDGLKK